MDDKYIAYILFKEGVSGQEIARIMKRSEKRRGLGTESHRGFDGHADDTRGHP